MTSLPCRRRERARALALLASVYVVVVVAAAGCEGPCGYSEHCYPSCQTDADCADGSEDGLVCRTFLHHDDQGPTCTRPCVSSADCFEPADEDTTIPVNAVCRCTVATEPGFCDPFSYELFTDEPPPELCAIDFSVASTCSLLCGCPCSFHGECPGTTLVAADCELGCADAYESFPACRSELDAYYFCAHRTARCVAETDPALEAGCPNDWPYCWGTTPEEACPDEHAALVACAMAPSWQFFYPSAP